MRNGSAVRSYGDFFRTNVFGVNVQRINLERKFRVPVSVNKYTKHGSTCPYSLAQGKPFKDGFIVSCDVAITQGLITLKLSHSSQNYLRVCCVQSPDNAWLTHRFNAKITYSKQQFHLPITSIYS